MEKFFKRSNACKDSNPSPSKNPHLEINIDDLPSDPGLRKKILDYHPNDRDKIRRAYLQKGPCQPFDHDFPQRKIGNIYRRFVPSWFKEYGNWLEYSVTKDAAFCLCCYLYRPDIGSQSGGDTFVTDGFTNWKKKERFETHVGGPSSSHNLAWMKCQNLMNQKQHIQVAYTTQSNQARNDYRIQLTASVDCVRFLLRQGLAFRGRDESDTSNNNGNFLQLLRFLADHNQAINSVVLDNARGNLKLIASDIQKDIAKAVAIETANVIINDVKGGLFSILIDESRDISVKEQLAIVLRYVNSKGCVLERFIGIVHVSDTTSLSLKYAIDEFFSKHGLSLSSLRGQGYDGASNMQGAINGLKTLILKENNSAYYVHCFAHQLQLALVAMAKNHVQVALLFNQVSSILNVVGASCKRKDILREKQLGKIVEKLQNGEISTGQGLHQETSLQRPGDTRWGSHYRSLVNVIVLFDSIVDVLEIILEDGTNSEQRGEAYALLDSIQSYEFIFSLHLMKNILGVTNELSQALQRKDQDIINAISLVKVSKQRLQMMRDDGWQSLCDEVSSFCGKHDIVIPNMDDTFVHRGRSRRNAQQVKNLHHYQVDLFYTVIDMQLQEMNDRFNEVNTELLLCVACLNPSETFHAFNKQKLIQLAKFYPSDFSEVELVTLANQLENYIVDMRSDDQFSNLKGISDLAIKLVESKKDIVYPLVFLLVRLALILPIATASVERVFSAMKIIKNRLRNRMGDSWMNDCLITYIEKDIFNGVDNEKILQRYQNMKTRRERL